MTDLSITEFITARYDEDEAVADRALSSPASAEIDNYGRLTVPAWRVLADIAAKRHLIARYERACQQADAERVADRWEEWRRVPLSAAGAARREEWETIASTLEGVLRQLASVYSDHPDFNPDWRVEP